MHAFDVLGDPVRRRILERLAQGEASSGEVVSVIQAEFGITQAAVSQHLKVLREAGFAQVRPEGTRRFYCLENTAMVEVDAWLNQFRPFWECKLDALGEELERSAAQPVKASPPVDESVAAHLSVLRAGTPREQAEALQALSRLAEEPVTWAAAAWPPLLEIASRRANENCAVAGRLLCLLAKDGQATPMLRDLDKVFGLVKDDRLAVARTVLREFWRVGLVSDDLRRAVVDRLQDWFHNCTTGKNSIQIRFDIIDGLAKLHRATGDPYVSQVTSTIVSAGSVPRRLFEGE